MTKVQISLVLLAAACCLMVAPTSAIYHIVGGSLGWSVPPNKTFFEEWAKPRVFGVEDHLRKCPLHFLHSHCGLFPPPCSPFWFRKRFRIRKVVHNNIVGAYFECTSPNHFNYVLFPSCPFFISKIIGVFWNHEPKDGNFFSLLKESIYNVIYAISMGNSIEEACFQSQQAKSFGRATINNVRSLRTEWGILPGISL